MDQQEPRRQGTSPNTSTKGRETFIAELQQVNAFVLFVGSRH